MVATPIGTLERIEHEFWYCDRCDRDMQCEHREPDHTGALTQCTDDAQFWVTVPYGEPGGPLTRMRYCREHTIESLEERFIDG